MISKIFLFLFHVQFLIYLSNGFIEVNKIDKISVLRSSLVSFIIGGHKSPKRPFFVKIRRNVGGTEDQFCGGTIIHPEWVLTTAHCIYDKNLTQVKVLTGDFTNARDPKTEVEVEILSWPTNFSVAFSYVNKDIGLIKVKNYIFPDETILDLCQEPPDLCELLGTCGLGATHPYRFKSEPSTLREIFLRERKLGYFSCGSVIGTIYTKRISADRDDNTCSGDSGGPLYWIGDFPNPDPICIYGVASTFGQFNIATENRCLLSYYYGGSYFTSVPQFYDWIWSVIDYYEDNSDY